MILLILFTALQFGLSMAYLSRTKVRDALDAAVLSAVSIVDNTSSPTYYSEKQKRDKDGNIYWVKTTKSYKEYLVIYEREAREIAEEYLHKNLRISKVKDYKVLSLDLKIVKDPYRVQVHKHRPHTEGIIRSWQENFPRWIRVEGVARVEVPAPLGSVFGRDRLVVQVKADSRKNLRNIPKGVWN
jgi:hypothetical protein